MNFALGACEQVISFCMKIYTLGTGAPLSYTSATTGFLVEAEACESLLIDTCSGFELIRRLVSLDKTPEQHHHALLTHRHGDHIGGVMALAIAVNPLHLYGSQDVLDAAKDILRICFGESAFNVLERVHFHPLQSEQSYTIAGYTVRLFDVDHRVPTTAVRLEHKGKVVAFSADSVPCENLVRCAQDADLFFCDALCSSLDGVANVQDAKALLHPTSDEAAELASSAGAKALALVHLARYAKPENMLKEARAIFKGSVTIPNDLDCFEL